MKKRGIILLVITLCTMLALAGCTSTEVPDVEGDGPQGNYDPLTFNNYGRELTIENKPEKVLTLGPNCTELFVALGLEAYIVGNSLDNHSRGALPEYKEAYDKVPEMNYSSATREAVISSGADFIYGIDWEFGGEALDIEELEDFGMKIYMNSATSLEEVYKEIEDLGKIFQVEEAAARLIEDQKSRIAAIETATQDQEPIKVLVYDSGSDGVFTCGGTNLESLLIERAGGKNIFDDIKDKQWITVSYEEVLIREPDVIVIHDYDAPSLGEKIEAIKSDPSLSKLKCVQEDKFVPISLESVLPGGRMAYSIELFAEGFYPQLF